MATAVDADESEVAAGLHIANLLAVAAKEKVLGLRLLVLLLAGPLEGLGPGPVAEPVADVIGVTGIDEHGDLLEQAGDHAMVGLHPVALEQEVAVDVEVAAVVGGDLGADSLHDLLLVEVRADPINLIVAQLVVTALAADIVDILSGALVRADHSVVTVDGGRDAGPDRLGLVAALDEAGAAGIGIVHGLARRLIQDGRPAALAAGHGTVVLVLSKTIGQTVPDQNGLQINVSLLVGENLRSEDGNVVSGIGLARDVEALVGVLRKLLEEEGEKGIDVLASSNRVADRAAAVRVADVDRLVQEDDGSIGIPGPGVVVHTQLLVDGRRAKLHEEAHKRGAAGAAIQPENDRIVLGVIAGLEEP